MINTIYKSNLLDSCVPLVTGGRGGIGLRIASELLHFGGQGLHSRLKSRKAGKDDGTTFVYR